MNKKQLKSWGTGAAVAASALAAGSILSTVGSGCTATCGACGGACLSAAGTGLVGVLAAFVQKRRQVATAPINNDDRPE